MARTVNAETLSHVKRWEGCKLKAYPDPGSRDGNPWTIGYGHTSDSFLYVTKGLTITQAQADAALQHDLNETAAAIADLVKAWETAGNVVRVVKWLAGAVAAVTILIAAVKGFGR